MASRRNYRWQDVNKSGLNLETLAQHFEVFNRSENKSPRTVEWYRQVLALFIRWLQSGGHPTSLGTVGQDEVRGFILHLQEKLVNGHPLSSHTVCNRVRALKAFFSWLAGEGYTGEDRLAKVRMPKATQQLIEPLSQEEVDRLFAAINPDTALGSRNTAVLALMLDTGLRLSEVSTLEEGDAHMEERYVKVMGKGAKERMVAFGATCQRALLRYYHHFRVEPAHGGVTTFFLTLDGYPMTGQAIKSMMDRLRQATGVRRLHPHLMRHTYATRFLLNGGDVFLLKQNLGHSTLAMVERYRHIASRQAALASQPFSPLDRMNSPALRRTGRRYAGNSLGIYPNAGKPREARPRSHRLWRGGHRPPQPQH